MWESLTLKHQNAVACDLASSVFFLILNNSSPTTPLPHPTPLVAPTVVSPTTLEPLPLTLLVWTHNVCKSTCVPHPVTPAILPTLQHCWQKAVTPRVNTHTTSAHSAERTCCPRTPIRTNRDFIQMVHVMVTSSLPSQINHSLFQQGFTNPP